MLCLIHHNILPEQFLRQGKQFFMLRFCQHSIRIVNIPCGGLRFPHNGKILCHVRNFQFWQTMLAAAKEISRAAQL